MADVKVTVETPSENQIIAVEFDGQEIIQPPLSLAEHFAKQASRIDFNEVDEDIDEQGDDVQADSQEEEDASSQSGKYSPRIIKMWHNHSFNQLYLVKDKSISHKSYSF